LRDHRALPGFVGAVIPGNLFQSGVGPVDIEQEGRFKLWRYLKIGKTIDNLPSSIMRAAYSGG